MGGCGCGTCNQTNQTELHYKTAQSRTKFQLKTQNGLTPGASRRVLMPHQVRHHRWPEPESEWNGAVEVVIVRWSESERGGVVKG